MRLLISLIASAATCSAAAQALLWTATGHPEQRAVYGVAFSANGQHVLSGSECPQARLRMFQTTNGGMTWDYQVSNSLLCSAGVKFSSNGQYLVNAEETGNLQVFQVSGSSASLLTTITNNTGALYSVDFSPASDKVAVGAGSGRLIVYSMPGGSQLVNVVAHANEVLGVSWSADGQFIATSGSDGLVKLWSSSGAFIRSFSHPGWVFGVKFTPDGQRIVSGGTDDAVRVWIAGTGDLERTITGHTGDVRSVEVSPNGAFIASASVDQSVRIWSLATGMQQQVLTATGSSFFVSVAWSPTENRIVAGGLNNMVAVWNVAQQGIPSVAVRPRVYLEGPYSTSTLQMNSTLRANGLVPLTEPFTSAGYAHAGGGGGEATSAAVLSITGANAVVDWVVVELRSSSAPALVLASRSALLQADGDVVNAADGTSSVTMNVPAGGYHVAVRHRNHLGIMSAAPVALTSNPLSLDFSNGSVGLLGGANAAKMVGTRLLMYAGDVNRNGTLQYIGQGNDRDPILTRIGGSTPTATMAGYFAEDVNLDGVVRYTGNGNDRDIILVNIGGSVPTSTRTEQLP
ncbi:MAG: WD40 repeat domain-containing protein [Flavobacteriales bacterium]|jgi:WD40 repeat protein|nr:WD40 repeat domain-containing protein [Flavobacteriales bacterium]